MHYIKKNRSLLSILVIAVFGVFLASGCGGDYRKKARGDIGKVYVVMDSTRQEGPLANALIDVFEARMIGLPSYEPRFTLKFVDFRSKQQLENLKKLRNIMFAAPLDEESNVADYIRALLGSGVKQSIRKGERFSIQLEDKWYRDQWIMILSAPDEETLIKNIRESGSALTQELHNKVIERWKNEVYERGEQTALADSIWNKQGWRIRVQHDYKWHVDTTNFISMRRFLPENDRWIWGWSKENVDNIEEIGREWINQKRDSLMKKFVKGSRDSSYVTTEYRRDIQTQTKRINGYFTFVTRGTWRMTNDFMGGPFINYTFFDDETRRIVMVEFGQFAPKYDKRRFVRQFEAMAHTFRMDSTYSVANR